MDQVVKNAPFGNDFTPSSSWRLAKKPKHGNPKTFQTNNNHLPSQSYFTDDFMDSSKRQLLPAAYSTFSDMHNNVASKFSNQNNFPHEIESSENSFEGRKTSKKDFQLPERSFGVEKDMENKSTSLESLVNLNLQKHAFSKRNLEEMFMELTSYDLERSGLINENQLNLMAIKYELPLKISTLRMLCHKFADGNFPLLVQYEEFFDFLAKCIPPKRRRDNESMNFTQADRSTATKQDLKDIIRSYPVNDKLVAMLKEQMTGAELWNLEKLYEALLDADRFHERRLMGNVVFNICIEQRVPLTKALIIKLLQQAEIDHGYVNWREFLAPIVWSCTEFSHKKSSNLLSRWNEKELPAHLPEHYQEIKYRNPIVHSQSSSLGNESSYRYVNNLKREATWSRNFAQLTSALKNFNPYKTDRVPRAEVERMLHNYNFIYELGFPPSFMKDAVKRAIVDKRPVDFEQTEIVSVDILLKVLSEGSVK